MDDFRDVQSAWLPFFGGTAVAAGTCYDSDRTTCSSLLHFLEEVEEFLVLLRTWCFSLWWTACA